MNIFHKISFFIPSTQKLTILNFISFQSKKGCFQTGFMFFRIWFFPYLFSFLLPSFKSCFVQAVNDPTLCKACSYMFYSDLPLLDPPTGFPDSYCNKSISPTRYDQKIYITNDTKDCSLCDGSLSKPYNNIVQAIIKAWNKAIAYFNNNIYFYLINTVHWINQGDWGTADVAKLFRRTYATLYLQPVLCTQLNIYGCYDSSKSNQLKTTIFIKTDRLYIFICYAMTVQSIIIDGSDIILSNLSSSPTTKVCEFSDLNASYNTLTMNTLRDNCALRNRPTFTSNDSYGLFTLETIIDDPNARLKGTKPTINLLDCEFISISSFNSNNQGFKSIIAGMRWSHVLNLQRTVFKYISLVSGIYTLMNFDQFYYPLFKKESEMDNWISNTENANKVKITIINSNITNFNAFGHSEMLYPAELGTIFLMQRVIYELVWTNVTLRENNPPRYSLSSSIFKMINPFTLNDYFCLFTLKISQFLDNYFSYLIQLQSTYNDPNGKPLTMLTFLNITSLNNSFINCTKSFMDVANANLTSSNDQFRNHNSYSMDFITLNNSNVSFYNCSFINFRCPIELNYGDSDLDGPKFIRFKSITTQDYDNIFDSPLSKKAATDNKVSIVRCLFENFQCPFCHVSHELVQKFTINFTTFKNISIEPINPLKNFIETTVEESFYVSNCLFTDISLEGGLIFKLVYNRNVSLINNIFSRVSASVLHCFLRPLNPGNSLIFQLMNSSFLNILTDLHLFYQDYFDVTSSFIGLFSNLSFYNISSTKASQIPPHIFDFYMEYVTLTNITFDFLTAFKILQFHAPSFGIITTFYMLNCLFSNSKVNQIASFLDIQDYSLIDIIDCGFFGKAILYSDKSFLSIDSLESKIMIERCQFNQMKGTQAGSLYIRTGFISNLLIKDCTFLYDVAEYLADIVFQIPNRINNLFNYYNNNTNGNNINNTYSNNSTKYTFNNANNESSSYNGNIIIIGPPFGLFNCSFNYIAGSAISLSQYGQMSIFNCSFNEVASLYSGAVLNTGSHTQILIIEANFSNIFSLKTGGVIFTKTSDLIIINTRLNTLEANKGGFVFASISNVTIDSANIQNVSAEDGGAFFIQESTLNILNSKFEKGNAYLGGFINSNKGNVDLFNIEFAASIAIFQGAVLYLENSAGFNFINVSMRLCQSQNSAIAYIYVMIGTRGSIQGLTCSDNIGKVACFAFKNGEIEIFNADFRNLTGLYIIKSESTIKSGKVTFRSCLFSSIVTTVNLILMNGVDLTIESTKFFRLENSKGSAIQTTFANLTIYLSEFDIFSEASSEYLNFSSDFTFIACTTGDVTINETIFQGRTYVSGFTSLNSHLLLFINSLFLQTYSETPGSALSIIRADSVYIDGLMLSQAKSLGTAGGIYFEDSEAEMKESYFEECESGRDASAVEYIIKTTNKPKNLKFINVSFVNNKNIAVAVIKATEFSMEGISVNSIEGTNFLKLNEIGVVSMKKMTIIGSKASSSGIIISSYSNVMRVNIEECEFNSSETVDNGGALFVTGIFNISIQNSTFFNNTSTKIGGAIFVDCLESILCKLEVYNCNFLNNSALFYGNSIYLANSLAVFKTDSPLLNSSVNHIGSKPFFLLIFPLVSTANLSASEKIDILKQKTFNFQFPEIYSGGTLNFSLVLFDEFGNVLELEQDGFFEVGANDFNDSSKKKMELFNNRQTVRKGQATFSELEVIGQPGFSYSLSINYISLDSRNNFNQTSSVSLRLCLRGEEFTGFQCLFCKKRFYSLHNFTISDSNDLFLCQPCQSKALCLGYDSLIPMEGYWRFDKDTTLMVKCNRAIQCPSQDQMIGLGDTETAFQNFKFEYKCRTGHYGNLCSQCEVGYGKDSNLECVRCAYSWLLYVRFAVISWAVILFLVLQAKTALSFSANDSLKRSFLKVIVDHFSFVSFISKLNVDWGSVIQQYFEVSDKFVTTAPAEIFNFSCFISFVVEDQEVIDWVNMILVSLSPVTFLLLVLFWKYVFDFAFALFQRRKNPNQKAKPKMGFVKNVIAVFMVVFYNFYPRLILSALFLFKCIKINDSSIDTYLEVNANIQCYSEKHIGLLLLISIPNLLIWGLGVPIFLCFLAFRFKILMKRTAKYEYWREILDYLTIDYQESKYYWETLLFFQKMLVVGLSIIISQLDPISQGGLMIMFFLVGFLVFNASKPSKYPLVNGYRVYSYMATICTAAFAILSSENTEKKELSSLALGGLMIVNTLFYGGWIINYLKLQYRILKQSQAFGTLSKAFNSAKSPRKSTSPRKKTGRKSSSRILAKLSSNR